MDALAKETLSTENTYITQEQYDRLQNLIEADDRVGFYLEVHELTGNSAALDMAEISSSSGIRGGSAQLIKEKKGSVRFFNNTLYDSINCGSKLYPYFFLFFI